MKLFILLVLLILSWSVYRSVKISNIVNVDDILEEKKKQASEDERLCLTGQKAKYGYLESGWSFVGCYVPAEDAGKECFKAADCKSNNCKVMDEELVKKNCEFRLESQAYVCKEISGICGDGGSIESGFYIGRKNHVFRKTYF